MPKIVGTQEPPGCATELGALKADIPADHDGVVTSIDCLRLIGLRGDPCRNIAQGSGHIIDFSLDGASLYQASTTKNLSIFKLS
jgi:hypothetical protein